ncbi:TetR family transcriptional regulator [Mycobacterium avium subsp. hominissuis]
MTVANQTSLTQRKRAATRRRIADAAAQLAVDNGLADTTVDRIAAQAEIGRATFFRYFGSKESAVAEAFSTQWFDRITAALTRQPAELGAIDAVRSAFAELADNHGDEEQIRALATLSASSPTLQAWTLHVHGRYERAIAELIAPRLHNMTPQDPRARLIGALAMAAVRIGLEDWLEHGGSLRTRVSDALAQVHIDDQH